jgi:hypothetical protein
VYYKYINKQELQMAYVVYDAETTRIVAAKPYGKDRYATEGAAKAAKTRMEKKPRFKGMTLVVCEAQAYKLCVEKMVERVNLMSGKTYWESINTPSYCSPASEAYWSM